MLLEINWTDPTIVGGLIGIFGSIAGAIIGALCTAFFTWLSLKGKIKIIVADNSLKFYKDNLYFSKSEAEKQQIEGSLFDFKLLVTNSKKDKYSLSSLELVLKNKISKTTHSFLLKDTSETFYISSLYYFKNAENFVINERTNAILQLQLCEEGMDFYNNYQFSKFYLRYVDYKGKKIIKRIHFSKINDNIAN